MRVNSFNKLKRPAVRLKDKRPMTKVNQHRDKATHTNFRSVMLAAMHMHFYYKRSEKMMTGQGVNYLLFNFKSDAFGQVCAAKDAFHL